MSKPACAYFLFHDVLVRGVAAQDRSRACRHNINTGDPEGRKRDHTGQTANVIKPQFRSVSERQLPTHAILR